MKIVSLIVIGMVLISPHFLLSMDDVREFYRARVSSIEEFRDRLELARLHLLQFKHSEEDEEALLAFKKWRDAILIDNFGSPKEDIWSSLTLNDVREYKLGIYQLYIYMLAHVAPDQKEEVKESFREILRFIQLYERLFELKEQEQHKNKSGIHSNSRVDYTPLMFCVAGVGVGIGISWGIYRYLYSKK